LIARAIANSNRRAIRRLQRQARLHREDTQGKLSALSRRLSAKNRRLKAEGRQLRL